MEMSLIPGHLHHSIVRDRFLLQEVLQELGELVVDGTEVERVRFLGGLRVEEDEAVRF